MDGYDASREIRRSEGGDRHRPIIAMTANEIRGDRERCRAAGTDDHISKPIELSALDAVLARSVEEPAPDAPAPPTAAIDPGSISEPRSLQRDRPSTTQDAGASAGPRFDHDQVAMLHALHIEGEPDIFALTGQIFLDTAPEVLGTLREGVARRDASASARAAHSLKGSAAGLGAAGLARACSELETATKLGTTAAEDEALARVEEEFRLAQAWLREEIG